jgi:hypothetical protein
MMNYPCAFKDPVCGKRYKLPTWEANRCRARTEGEQPNNTSKRVHQTEKRLSPQTTNVILENAGKIKWDESSIREGLLRKLWGAYTLVVTVLICYVLKR